MKKIISIIILLAISAGMVSCGGGSRSMLDVGDEIIGLLSETAACDEYLSLLINPVDSIGELITKVQAVDFANPAAVYELEIDHDELLKTLLEKYEGFDQLPNSLKERLINSARQTLTSRLNSTAGAGYEETVVSSLINANKCFVDKSIKEAKYLLYVYEPGCSVLVSFIPHEDGAVTASGNLILNENFECGDAEQIEASFNTHRLSVTVLKKLK